MSFAQLFLNECHRTIELFDMEAIERAALALRQVRENGGRLFVAGSGGGAGHASHAVCDFRKLCDIDAYAPYDNVSELTARVNDDGWESSLANTLKVSKLTDKDAILLFSVGGGDEERSISANLVKAAQYAKSMGAKVVAVVGRDGGYLGKHADAAVVIPPVNPELITPITEGFQAIIWHLLVSHPLLQKNSAKWESQSVHAQNSQCAEPQSESEPTFLLRKLEEAANLNEPASDLYIKIFADGADINEMKQRSKDPMIAGFTTNPTLMRKSGVSDYVQFAKAALEAIPDKPISFEVFSDDFDEMEKQALEIANWGQNVYVKVPITNSKGESALPLIERLVAKQVRLNVTAITALEQVEPLVPVLARGPACIVSIFAGRIADTGRDPVEIVEPCLELVRAHPNIELLWASPREIYNLVQANNLGCHIITMTEDILKKMPILNTDLLQMSLDTVTMFHRDATAAAYTIPCSTKTAAV